MNSLTDASRAHEGGEEKWPPGQIFPVCPGEARSGRNQGAKHPAAPLACASGETGPTWIRDVAVEKGTKDRNETSRNCRMQVGPALPGAHAGEFSRQARPGRRGGKRVADRAAIQNPEGLPGRSPGRFGRPGGAATEPRRGDGILLLGSMFLALGGCIAGPIVGPIAAAIGEP